MLTLRTAPEFVRSVYFNHKKIVSLNTKNYFRTKYKKQ